MAKKRTQGEILQAGLNAVIPKDLEKTWAPAGAVQMGINLQQFVDRLKANNPNTSITDESAYEMINDRLKMTPEQREETAKVLEFNDAQKAELLASKAKVTDWRTGVTKVGKSNEKLADGGRSDPATFRRTDKDDGPHR